MNNSLFKGGRLCAADKYGNKIILPEKRIYQFKEKNLDPRLKKWLRDKGVDEVREGK
ncbi:hypothetical protein SAMN05443633_12053 [Chryseobacterium arachidis]|uniref:Uncharacterized protein n=2 Tax=Chryseobacterium arachidis TaxID=1416778 RepID=A0A1M5LXB8_9FLAO|nr:hypothetical protein SAMN05443633_12053 [Chryseobacterium arachidis]